MNDFHAIIFAALTLAAVAMLVALCFIAFELRAVRKVLQARWDYDRYKQWLQFKQNSQSSYALYAPALLQKPYILLDMSEELHETHRVSDEIGTNIQTIILQCLEKMTLSTSAMGEPPVQKQEAPSSSQVPR